MENKHYIKGKNIARQQGMVEWAPLAITEDAGMNDAGMEETLYLMRDPYNHAILMQRIQNVRLGINLIERELIEVEGEDEQVDF